MTNDPRVGTLCWFEYHCWEDHRSKDAELWYHSHQQVLVLEVVDPGSGDTFEERAECAELRHYRVRFADGFEADAGEDGLLDSPAEFERPDPPRPSAKWRRIAE